MSLVTHERPPATDLAMPTFAHGVAPMRQRIDRWKHNGISWLTVPMTRLGSVASAGSFGVLMYHRVCEAPPRIYAPTYNVQPTRFARQLHWLTSHGYQVWPLSRLAEARLAGEVIPPRVFAVTFDDGYANNFTQALPILKSLKIPATVFLATAYLDSDEPYPFDYWAQQNRQVAPAETWMPLATDQCNAMLDSRLIEFGCHTHTHADFRERPECLRHDLRLCLNVLKDVFSVTQPAFGYPYGTEELGFADESLANISRDLGCCCALQIGNRVVETSDDLFHWPRFDVASGDNGPSLAGKIDGWYQRLRGGWRSLTGRSS